MNMTWDRGRPRLRKATGEVIVTNEIKSRAEICSRGCDQARDPRAGVPLAKGRLDDRPTFGNLRNPLGTRASCPHFSIKCGQDARVPRQSRKDY